MRAIRFDDVNVMNIIKMLDFSLLRPCTSPDQLEIDSAGPDIVYKSPVGP